jgi:hypothetical protein
VKHLLNHRHHLKLNHHHLNQIVKKSKEKNDEKNDELIAKQKEHHRTLFTKALDEEEDDDEVEVNKENDNGKKKSHSTSFIVDRARCKLIISYLKGEVEGKEDPSFKHNISKNRFNIQEIDGKEILYRTVTHRPTKNKAINLNEETLPVAIKEDFFEIIYLVHSLNVAHPGQAKAYDAICMRYHGIPKKITNMFVRLCPHFNLKHKQMSQPRLNPIRSEAPMQRFQIDLVDMRHNRQVLDDRRYIDKNLSKKDKEAKAKATKEKKETRFYE